MSDQPAAKDDDMPGTGGKELPSIFINRFSILVNPVTTRIAFGQAVVGLDTTYHTAVVMTTQNAVELAELILRLVKQNRETVAKKEAYDTKGP